MFIIDTLIRGVIFCFVLGGGIVASLIGLALQHERASKTKKVRATRKREKALLAHWQECVPCNRSLRGQFVDARGIPHFEGCRSHSGRDWSRS